MGIYMYLTYGIDMRAKEDDFLQCIGNRQTRPLLRNIYVCSMKKFDKTLKSRARTSMENLNPDGIPYADEQNVLETLRGDFKNPIMDKIVLNSMAIITYIQRYTEPCLNRTRPTR